jgi:HEAT repeat protein
MAIFKPGRPDIKKLEAQRKIDEIIELLGYPDRDVQYEAIEAVTRLGDPRGIEALMSLVADPRTDELIRAKAWLALDVGWEREAKKRTGWK